MALAGGAIALAAVSLLPARTTAPASGNAADVREANASAGAGGGVNVGGTNGSGANAVSAVGDVGDPSDISDAVTREAAATINALASVVPEGTPAASARGLGAFPVRDAQGNTISIVRPGEPAIVMINSRTCGYCKQALRDLAAHAGGRPVPGLRMLTLEGAADGVPMLAEAGITGGVPLGPATSQSQVLLAFRYRGTPTFVAVDAEGRIRGTMPGYPGPERLAPWFDVMLGDRATP